MVFQNKLVAAIKVAGKILRENKDSVTLPFGCEYSILVKNLDSRRVQIKVSVDGRDATEGTWLVIAPNSSIELERFIRNGNFDRGNRFKFIERTSEIEAHRGIDAEDGLIRIEYRRERIVREEETIIRKTVVEEYPWYWPQYPRPWSTQPWPRRPYPPRFGSSSMRPVRKMASATSRPSGRPSAPSSKPMLSRSGSRDGITVAGSESNQRFSHAPWFDTEAQSEVIVLKLRGCIGNIPIQSAVTVDMKPQCSTCGKTNKADSTFCSKCGTALQVI